MAKQLISIALTGSRKEHINRAAVGEVLAQIEPECKKSVSAVLSHVQDRLLKLTGYLIVPGDAIKGYSKGKRDELYLVNTLLLVSPSLSEADVRNVRAVLQNGTPTTSVAFQGFKFVIFHLIYSGNGHKITLSEISRQLHKLDIRFPKTLSTAAKTSTSRDSLASVPELGQSLLDMLERLRKEEYVVVSKDEADSADTMRNIYEWGPRFYLEVCSMLPLLFFPTLTTRFFLRQIGVRNLLISYYHILGQPVDEMELKLLEEVRTFDREYTSLS
jgi:hypothetical protein